MDAAKADPAAKPTHSAQPSQPAPTQLLDRLQDLEVRYTHLERLVVTLNEVVIEQGRALELLQRKMAAFGMRLDNFATSELTPRSLEDDKPPHY